jgi:UDP-glucuronate 4-epimerase
MNPVQIKDFTNIFLKPPTHSYSMKVLVTGAAGFIGYHVSQALLTRGDSVIGIDNFHGYLYDPSIKEARAKNLAQHKNFKLYRVDILDYAKLTHIFQTEKPDMICHLAAYAGVLNSINDPFLYQRVNVEGTLNMLELARKFPVKNFVFASSSSVYGANKKVPFSEEDNVDRSISPYAATKKSNEIYGHCYHHLFGFPVTGLRFFTSYGPYGRPDMSMFKFADAILKGEEVQVYGDGTQERDFTYIDDTVSGIIAALDKPHPYEIFNLGNAQPISVNEVIKILEKSIGKKAKVRYVPPPEGEIPKAFADIKKARKLLGWAPKTDIQNGISKLVEWYIEWVEHQPKRAR